MNSRTPASMRSWMAPTQSSALPVMHNARGDVLGAAFGSYITLPNVGHRRRQRLVRVNVDGGWLVQAPVVITQVAARLLGHISDVLIGTADTVHP